MRFQFAITRQPGPEMVQGISSAHLGQPDFDLAMDQHDAYVRALEQCGVEVIVLPSDSRYPDGCFVEDTAVLAETVAVVDRPGAATRQGEEAAIAEALKVFYSELKTIDAPGSLEGGDVMRVINHFYIGLSERTNAEGARQLIAYLEEHGYTGSTVEMNEMLHLKTGVNYLDGATVMVAGEFIDHPAFKEFTKIVVPDEEAYAANSLWVNDRVLVPMGFPKTLAAIREAGYVTLDVDVSEF
ncbi:N(G),N(G)-dimethylarginine dimethylaminohydrolase, partial [bacterium]|nr:N(G),N(G)-dimethylarginine dimethylaminohydrolase [bacterium]